MIHPSSFSNRFARLGALLLLGVTASSLLAQTPKAKSAAPGGGATATTGRDA